jgi:hypothetical protein
MSKGISGTQLVQNLKEGFKDGMILTKKDKTFIGELYEIFKISFKIFLQTLVYYQFSFSIKFVHPLFFL